MNIIELEHLTKRYGAHRGIEDLTLSVREGEIYGFIGPNGAGKSTTIRAMLDLIHPTSGTAKIFGMDCQTQGAKIRLQIGYLPGEVNYYENMRVGDFLDYSAKFYPGDHKKRISELSDYMELDLKRKLGELSFGNKKKVGIVQGLLHNPKLLLLDEPTAGLDPLMQQRFFELIRRENQKGVTVFFSSHILSEVQRLCGRVAILRDGRLVEEQSVEALRVSNYSRVRLTAFAPLGKEFAVKGAVNTEISGCDASFLYRGSPNTLMEQLRNLPLNGLWIEEPSLDEIFLHYYEGGDEHESVSL